MSTARSNLRVPTPLARADVEGMSWPDLFERARRPDRGGVLVRQDAPDCGMDVHIFDRVVADQRWERPYRGTVLLPGAVATPHVLLRAAALSMKPPVAVDRWSAAWLHGVRRRTPAKPMLVVPVNRQSRRRDIVVRRSVLWVPEHVAVVDGIPVLIPARLVVDLAHLDHGERELRDLCLSLRLRTGMTGDDLRQVLDTYERHGNRGLVLELARLLDMVGSESGLEQLVREMLESVGLTPDAFQMTVEVAGRRRRLDIVFGDARVGIEVQSREYHGDFGAMTRDARKINALAFDGEWLVLVLTPEMLTGEAWDEFVMQLRHLLDTRGRRAG